MGQKYEGFLNEPQKDKTLLILYFEEKRRADLAERRANELNELYLSAFAQSQELFNLFFKHGAHTPPKNATI